MKLLGFWTNEDVRVEYDPIGTPEIYVPADWTNPAPCLLVTRSQNGPQIWEGAIVVVPPYLADTAENNIEIVAGVAWVAAKEKKKIQILKEFSITKEWGNRNVETFIPDQHPRPLLVLHRGEYEGDATWEILRHWNQWSHPMSIDKLHQKYVDDVYPHTTGVTNVGRTRTKLVAANAMTIGAFRKLLGYAGLPNSNSALLKAYPLSFP